MKFGNEGNAMPITSLTVAPDSRQNENDVVSSIRQNESIATGQNQNDSYESDHTSTSSIQPENNATNIANAPTNYETSQISGTLLTYSVMQTEIQSQHRTEICPEPHSRTICPEPQNRINYNS